MSNKDGPKHERKQSPISARRVKKLMVLSNYLSKQESRKTFKLVTTILQKAESDRTTEEETVLKNNSEVVKRIQKNKARKLKSEERVQEKEDGEQELQAKCAQLAGYIRRSKKVVVYTGAGISTAASIPDYRGPQGVWTLLQKGETLQPLDLSDAEPTYTHMCIAQLFKEGHVKHVVSQNCDGLHLRSGLPRHALSEVHGNMYIEVCHKCRPHREYIRLFDATENTGVRRHQTGRFCKACGGPLRDTIVHFGEKGGLKSPYRWKEAGKAAEKSDLIICLGSSLKILKSYGCLWLMDRSKNKRPNLVIVNLQWTPKDDSATLKINGKCDDVLERVMKKLAYTVEPYKRETDPIFRLCAPLAENEFATTTKKLLQAPAGVRNLRSRSTSRTPSLSDTESSSSSSSSSSEISDTVDVEEEEDPLVPKKPLDEIINEVKLFISDESPEFIPLHEKDSQDVEIKEEVKNDHDIAVATCVASLTNDHKYSISNCAQNFVSDVSPKLDTNIPYMSNHKTDTVDTNSLNVYRQLLQLHLLQMQLEQLKWQQREQHGNQFPQGMTRNSQESFDSSPEPGHGSLGPTQFSPGSLQNFTCPSPLSPEQQNFPVLSPTHSFGSFPDYNLFHFNEQLNSSDVFRQQMEHVNNQGLNPLSCQKHFEMKLQPAMQQDNILKSLGPVQSENLYRQKVGQFVLPNHQMEGYVSSVRQSHLPDIKDSHLPNGRQHNLPDLVSHLQRRIQMQEKQERNVSRMQHQMELEKNRCLKGQVLSQQSLIQQSSEIETNRKTSQTQMNERNKYPEGANQLSRGSELQVTSLASRAHNVPDTKILIEDKDIFKEPFPFHSYAAQQTDTRKLTGLESLSQNSSLSSNSFSSKTDNADCKQSSEHTKDSNKSAIPGFSELVNSLTMCQSCQFLREYGIHKRSCSMCKDLKAAHSVLNTQWMPNKQHSPPKSPRKPPSSGGTSSVTRKSVPNSKLCSGLHSDKLDTRAVSASTHAYSEKDLQAKNLGQMHGYPATVTECYQFKASRNQGNSAMKSKVKCKSPDFTKHSDEKLGSVSHRSLLNAENNIRYDNEPKFDIGATDETTMQTVATTSETLATSSSTLPGSFSPNMLADSVMNKDTYHLKSDSYNHFAMKSRVSSEPELHKLTEKRNDEGNSAQRQRVEQDSSKGIKRSHSQSEVEETHDDVGESVTDSADIVDEIEQSKKKKKLARCVSVPGWFGKGLNLKKRRKY